MQTTSAIAALLDPFTPQGGVSGVGASAGLGAPVSGLGDNAGDEPASDGGQFGDALAAAMAAALGAPPPAQPIAAAPSTPQGEVTQQSASGPRQAQPAVFAPMMLQADEATASAVATADVAIPASTQAPELDIAAAQAVATANEAQTVAPPLANAPAKALAGAQPIASAAAPVAEANASAPKTPQAIPAQVQNPAASSPRASASAQPLASPPTSPQTPAQAPIQTEARDPVQTEAKVRATTAAQVPAETGVQPQAQARAAASSSPVVATIAPNVEPPAPSPNVADPSDVAAAAARTEPATPAAAVPVATQVAQAQATQIPATPVKPASAGAEGGGRSAKAKAPSGSAVIEAGNATGAPVKAEAQPQAVAARAQDDLPPPAADEQSTPVEADTEQPALAAASPGATEHPALHSAPVETPRATPQTVALLAGQIASKVDGKSTRFDVQLDPHGLGKVDIRVEISARGDVSAALTFENPQAASELRGKAGELQTALEQAGFDLSKTSLSFNSGGQGQPQQGLFDQQQQSQTPMWRGRAFTDFSDTPEAAPAPVQRRAAAGGVDVRI